MKVSPEAQVRILKSTIFFFTVLLFNTILLAQKGGGHGGGGGHSGGHSAGSHGGNAAHYSPPICSIAAELTNVDFHNEFIKLKNADTLRVTGIFSVILKRENNESISDMGILLKEVRGYTQSFISFREIEYLRVNDYDKTLPIKNYAEFSRIDTTGRLWRKIADGKAKVFDDIYVCNENIGEIGDRFRIVTTNKVYAVDINLRSKKGAFNHFINKRYKEHFKKKDFISVNDMIKYIAQRG